jgi:hypothetical protein
MIKVMKNFLKPLHLNGEHLKINVEKNAPFEKY